MKGIFIYVLLIFTVIVKNIQCDTWRYQNEMVNSRIMQINGSVDMSIVFKTANNTNLIECSIQCNKYSSLSFYFVTEESKCYCNSAVAINANEPVVTSAVTYGYETTKRQTYIYEGFRKIHLHPEPFDCKELFENGYKQNGVYVIRPGNSSNTDVWCDMTNGGWTVIQKRLDGTEDFDRTWTEYVQGFGNRTGEYWLGLETIRHLVEIPSKLSVAIEAFNDTTPKEGFAEYSEFAIGNAIENYPIHINGFMGDVGDSLTRQNDQMFTTKDRDNDILQIANCAEMFSGGWWYKKCHQSNLNGNYTDMNPTEYGHGVLWATGWGYEYSVAKTIMKVIRN